MWFRLLRAHGRAPRHDGEASLHWRPRRLDTAGDNHPRRPREPFPPPRRPPGRRMARDAAFRAGDQIHLPHAPMVLRNDGEDADNDDVVDQCHHRPHGRRPTSATEVPQRVGPPVPRWSAPHPTIAVRLPSRLATGRSGRGRRGRRQRASARVRADRCSSVTRPAVTEEGRQQADVVEPGATARRGTSCPRLLHPVPPLRVSSLSRRGAERGEAGWRRRFRFRRYMRIGSGRSKTPAVPMGVHLGSRGDKGGDRSASPISVMSRRLLPGNRWPDRDGRGGGGRDGRHQIGGLPAGSKPPPGLLDLIVASRSSTGWSPGRTGPRSSHG